MARAREWVTEGIVTAAPQQLPIVRNLLGPVSGTSGVTVIRSLVTLSVRLSGSLGTAQQFIRAGLLVGDAPTGAELSFGAVDSHDWTWYGMERLPVVTEAGGIVTVEADPGGRLAAIETKGARRLEAGQSLYLLFGQPSGVQSMTDTYAILARTLYLAPD